MADPVKVTEDARGRRLAAYTGALLCLGAVIGVGAALWLFDGEALDGEDHAGEILVTGAEVVDAVPATEVPVKRKSGSDAHKSVRTARPATPAIATPDPAAVDPEPEVAAGEYIEALRAAGETGGIAAFNPPGTDPIKNGIIVPDDYELPDGYARRYQTTDDGKQLPPILMFSPDFEFLDANGKPIPLPDDLIVPPEMAPPGLPLRMLQPGNRADR